jgi:hypothetical protein
MLKIRLNLASSFGNSARLVMQIHDEIVVEVLEPSLLEEVVSVLISCMETVPTIRNSIIPFPVKVRTGPSLGELEDFNFKPAQDSSSFSAKEVHDGSNGAFEDGVGNYFTVEPSQQSVDNDSAVLKKNMDQFRVNLAGLLDSYQYSKLH